MLIRSSVLLAEAPTFGGQAQINAIKAAQASCMYCDKPINPDEEAWTDLDLAKRMHEECAKIVRFKVGNSQP